MTDFLLELRSEEMPARMQRGARAELVRLFEGALAAGGLRAGDVTVYSGPRRLALIARGLPDATPGAREELKGPRAAAPPQAIEGFLRKTGLTRDALEERDGVLFAVVERPGRPTAALLAEAVPAIVRAFAWPKSMRWGAASAAEDAPRWVRPLHGIVALFGAEVVACEAAGITAGAATLGHRFHHPGPITLRGADDYVEKLRACHVLVDHEERAAAIREGAGRLAAAAGLTLVEDEGLVEENAGLTEWPVPLIGRFDPAALDLPPEVIALTARANQKYFVCRDEGGALAPAFVCVANVAAADGGAGVVRGNERVLAARLSDARFFWDNDLRVPLDKQAAKLGQIVFHEKLGTVADKVERVAKLARWLCEEGIVKSSPSLLGEGDHAKHGGGVGDRNPSTTGSAGGPPPRDELGEDLPALAYRAARLAKADLVTGMVGEFPELQGIVGGHIARAQGEPREVWEAVRDHYKPVGQGDEVPTAPVTVAVSLADKLDTLAAFVGEGILPTGSKDPFALRRTALAGISVILNNSLRIKLSGLLHSIYLMQFEQRQSFNVIGGVSGTIVHAIIIDRLKVQQREAGVRHDLIDAVFALGDEDDLVRLLARVRALQALLGTEDGANLLVGYRRAANILRKEGWDAEPNRHPELVSGSMAGSLAKGEGWMLKQVQHDGVGLRGDGGVEGVPSAESALVAALDAAEPAVAAAVEVEDFAGAMRALAGLRAPVDHFFEHVTVNDPDPAVRARRLALLARLRGAAHRVADFSKIEG